VKQPVTEAKGTFGLVQTRRALAENRRVRGQRCSAELQTGVETARSSFQLPVLEIA
jgi:hypothetical protein